VDVCFHLQDLISRPILRHFIYCLCKVEVTKEQIAQFCFLFRTLRCGINPQRRVQYFILFFCFNPTQRGLNAKRPTLGHTRLLFGTLRKPFVGSQKEDECDESYPIMGSQARTGDTVLTRSREMTGRTQTLPCWLGGGGGGTTR
jgi:hypothetical protein